MISNFGKNRKESLIINVNQQILIIKKQETHKNQLLSRRMK